MHIVPLLRYLLRRLTDVLQSPRKYAAIANDSGVFQQRRSRLAGVSVGGQYAMTR